MDYREQKISAQSAGISLLLRGEGIRDRNNVTTILEENLLPFRVVHVLDICLKCTIYKCNYPRELVFSGKVTVGGWLMSLDEGWHEPRTVSGTFYHMNKHMVEQHKHWNCTSWPSGAWGPSWTAMHALRLVDNGGACTTNRSPESRTIPIVWEHCFCWFMVVSPCTVILALGVALLFLHSCFSLFVFS